MSLKQDPGETTRRTRRFSDLQFAALASACVIVCVLVAGALLAPLMSRVGLTGSEPSHARDQTVHLSPPELAPESETPQLDGHRLTAPRSATVTFVRLRGAQNKAPRLSLDGKTGGRPGPAVSKDSDGDGLPDLWEIRYGLDPHDSADGRADGDRDGLDNLSEMRLHMAPGQRDSNHNGVADGDEDSDVDGLRNRTEIRTGSDPTLADSNHDGQSG
jgi:Bacterial TSP3 repeat